MRNKTYSKDGDGLRKLRELLNDNKVLLMATNLKKIPFSVCPMSLQEMDVQGDLWFFAHRNSDHFKDIEKDNRVQLLLANEKGQQYLSMYGNATHIVDREKKQALWSPMLGAWFDGIDDPNSVLLNVNLESAYYWDMIENKWAALHRLQGSLAGQEGPELGEKGHIDLQNH
ncbi:pyridoxamine 5'-phosphate oxidase family protein [Pseudozobellia thermophila]|uniref:General stress protein 26 n=1 Tax=Pseudozobellia thermophila TaxID=192903 RepID=A0A1M6BCV4_9FLAO|nr:pyridoxamine 5'-phosphate oxidase family protein [Pseudozobellia thermophila]SHI46562.1 General stress protein 26 [Pseudozobellia thermophila]